MNTARMIGFGLVTLLVFADLARWAPSVWALRGTFLFNLVAFVVVMIAWHLIFPSKGKAQR